MAKKIWGEQWEELHQLRTQGSQGTAYKAKDLYNEGSYVFVKELNDKTPVYRGNHNIEAWYNKVGGLAAEIKYNAYGLIVAKTGQPFANFGFQTQYTDLSTGLICYEQRWYDPRTQTWVSLDPIEEQGGVNLYGFCGGNTLRSWDVMGMFSDGRRNGPSRNPDGPLGHSDFTGGERFDYTAEDYGPNRPSLSGNIGAHFQPLDISLRQVVHAIENGDKGDFELKMHRLQDYFSHYMRGYRTWGGPGLIGHAASNISGYDPDDNREAWNHAENFTKPMISLWEQHIARRQPDAKHMKTCQ